MPSGPRWYDLDLPVDDAATVPADDSEPVVSLAGCGGVMTGV